MCSLLMAGDFPAVFPRPSRPAELCLPLFPGSLGREAVGAGDGHAMDQWRQVVPCAHSPSEEINQARSLSLVLEHLIYCLGV